MMKHPKILHTLAAASALALGIGMSGYAHAGAYALSYLNFTDALVFFIDQNGDPADVTLDPTTPLSSAEARLNGNGVLTGGIGFTDAPPANAPLSDVTRLNNVFNAFGPSTTLDYSNADAWIRSQQSADPTSFTQTLSIAEGNTGGGGSGDADAQNSSITGFEINFVVNQDAQMTLAFSADLLLRVLLHDDAAVPPSVAFSEITASATITDSTGAIVFQWTPDGDCVGGAGVCAGITGGTELQDDLSMNTDLTTVGAGSDFSFGGGTPGAFNIAPNDFAAITNILAVGEYTLAVVAETDIGFLGEKVAVPEPATLALMGMGLLGMGITRRRRKA